MIHGNEAIIKINGKRLYAEESHRIFLEDNKLTLEIKGLWSVEDVHILHGGFEKEIECISLGRINMTLVHLDILAEMDELVHFNIKFQ